MKKFCCQQMMEYTEDTRIAIRYRPSFREYGILLYQPNGEVCAFQGIYFCPWCGQKLPQGLRDEWMDLAESLGLGDDMFEIEENPNLPEEMKTDEWWIKRGL